MVAKPFTIDTRSFQKKGDATSFFRAMLNRYRPGRAISTFAGAIPSNASVSLTRSSAIDALPTPNLDVVYWDAGFPGFGVKVTPKGRKVFVVLYRTGGAGSKLRKYTIGPYGRVTLHQARVAAQRVFAAKVEGRDPAAEKREAKRRVVADRVEDLLESFIAQCELEHVCSWRCYLAKLEP